MEKKGFIETLKNIEEAGVIVAGVSFNWFSSPN